MTYGTKIQDNVDVKIVIKWLAEQFQGDIADQIKNLGIQYMHESVVIIPENFILLNEKEAEGITLI